MKSKIKKRLLLALSLFFILLIFFPSGAGAEGGYVPVAVWGSQGTENGQFLYPGGIATDASDNVYVADTYNYRIQKFDSSGNFLTQWGSYGSGNEEFSLPHGIATDADGYVYVADTYNYRIQKFDSSGNFLTQWGSYGSGNEEFKHPYGIATDADGYVYVADAWNNRIQKFDSSGNWQKTWGSSGSGNGQFYGPYGIATDADGNVYVTDNGNSRIQKFDSDGTFLTQWGSYGSGEGEFYHPYGIATDGAGNVYVADTFNNRIQKFDSDGTFLTQWGSQGTGEGEFNWPLGIATDADGNVYVVDTDNHRIQKFSPDTTKPWVGSVTLNPASPVRAGPVTFTIVFSENMDNNVSPTVTFGKEDPYNEHTIDKTNYSADTWVGAFTIEAGYDGEQHLSISGAQDLADNVMDPDTSHTFLVDTTSPAGSIFINGGAGYTNSRSVTLTFNASSSSASLSLANASPSWMRFSNEDFVWTDWESYASSKSWTLSSDDGEKTVYAEFKDPAGNLSKTYSDSIILHRTPPTVAITSPCAESCLRGEVTVEGTATDDYFEKYEIEFAEGLNPSSWHQITSCCFAVVEAELCCWNVNSLSDGTYTLKLTAWDLASNFAEVKVALKVDNHPPQTTLTEYPPEKVTGNTPKAVVPFSWIGSDADNITPVEKLVYQYRLEGHSNYQDWSAWSKDSTSTFLLPSGNYTFKVRAKDEAGNYPSEDDAETARYSFTVSLPLIIYPNPCYLNQAGFLTFSNLPLESEVRIYIYDLAGSLVRILGETDAVIQGGSKVATWNLKNDNGEMLTRGIYIYYILSATEKRTGKIAIIN